MSGLLIYSVFTLIVTALGYVAYSLKRKREAIRGKTPNGPMGLPLLGNLTQLGPYPHKTLMKWKEIYGPVVAVKFGSFSTIVINDYKLIKEALSDPACSGRPDIPMFLERSGGQRHGILFSDGNEWTEQRRFILRHLRDFGFGKKSMEVIIQEEAEKVSEQLAKLAGQPIALRDRFSPAVINSLWAFIAGEQFQHDDPKLHDIIDRIDKNMDEVNGLTALTLFMPWLVKYFRKLSGHEEIMKDLETVLDFMRIPIKEHEKTHIPGQNRDLIDVYIEEIKNCKDPDSSFYKELGIRILEVVCMDLFGTGIETTTTALCWAFLYLAVHPKVQEKLQEEIDHVIGPSRRPCLDDKPKMPYLEAVTMEIHRFSSLVPLALFHNTLSDTKLADYFIPKDTMVIPNLYGCHFDKEYWGDPENFRPERFLSPDGKTIIRHDAFLAFSYGKRVCLGEGLARAELFLFIATLFQRFNVSTVPGENPTLEPRVSTALAPQPHKLILLERNTE